MYLIYSIQRINPAGYTPHGQVLTSNKYYKFPLLYQNGSEVETTSYPVDVVGNGRDNMKLTTYLYPIPKDMISMHNGIRHRDHFTL
jgi:hypothetical protein